MGRGYGVLKDFLTVNYHLSTTHGFLKKLIKAPNAGGSEATKQRSGKKLITIKIKKVKGQKLQSHFTF